MFGLLRRGYLFEEEGDLPHGVFCFDERAGLDEELEEDLHLVVEAREGWAGDVLHQVGLVFLVAAHHAIEQLRGHLEALLLSQLLLEELAVEDEELVEDLCEVGLQVDRVWTL